MTTFRINRRFATLGMLVVPLLPATAAPAGRERIDALLQALAARTELRFLREDKVYTAAEAARFLHGKLAARGAGMKSAELFIQRIASRSSSTGRNYLVLWPGGRQQAAADFLTEELARVDAALAKRAVSH